MGVIGGCEDGEGCAHRVQHPLVASDTLVARAVERGKGRYCGARARENSTHPVVRVVQGQILRSSRRTDDSA